MASISKLSDKWVLVIDDMENMRSLLSMSLSSCGFARLHVVANINEALKRMANNHYDVILCDYYLGDSTNGQQFLEHLRNSDLINRSTIFIMITAEKSYETVVTICECTPDDYLLKPFTSAQFNTRLEKLLEKQEYFSPIDKATDSKDWSKVIAECDRMLPARDKYFIDLCKIKGAALIRDNRAQEACDLYREILALRPLAWARLGLARSLAMLDSKDEAQAILQETLTDTPQFMAAYDFLGKLLVSKGDKHAALDVLQKAREVSPGTMSRIRELSSLAVSADKPEIAETVMQQALKQHRHSPIRQVSDYALLSMALINQGKISEALNLMVDARHSFKDEHSQIVLSATESVAYHAAGDQEMSASSMARALSGGAGNLPVQSMISVAEACFAMGKQDDATGLLRQVVQNNPDDNYVREKVHNVLVSAGKDASEAAAFIDEGVREVISINNDGVNKAKAGQLEEAIELLCSAADRLPNNLQIVGNAALVAALDLVRNGSSRKKLERCLHYRDVLVNKSPNHPKLIQINKQLNQLK